MLEVQTNKSHKIGRLRQIEKIELIIWWFTWLWRTLQRDESTIRWLEGLVVRPWSHREFNTSDDQFPIKLAWGCSYELRETTDTWQGEEHLVLMMMQRRRRTRGKHRRRGRGQIQGDSIFVLVWRRIHGWIGRGDQDAYVVAFPYRCSNLRESTGFPDGNS